MIINEDGLKLIKSFEGLKLRAYLDSVGIPTIGYGHIDGVKIGDIISQDKADQLLKSDIEKFEKGVEKLLTTPVTPNEFSALVCFAFNVGLGNLKSSTLLKVINSGHKDEAFYQFKRWNKAGGIVLAGLTARRLAEANLFIKV